MVEETLTCMEELQTNHAVGNIRGDAPADGILDGMGPKHMKPTLLVGGEVGTTNATCMDAISRHAQGRDENRYLKVCKRRSGKITHQIDKLARRIRDFLKHA